MKRVNKIRLITMSPNFCPCHQCRPKNGDKQFQKQKFCAINRKAQHALMMDTVFSFWGWGGRNYFLCLSLVPNVFSACSHQVLKCVPQDVPNSTWVLSHTVCPKFNCPGYKLERSNPKGGHLFFFCNWGPKVLLLGACPMFQKQLLMGQSIWLLELK